MERRPGGVLPRPSDPRALARQAPRAPTRALCRAQHNNNNNNNNNNDNNNNNNNNNNNSTLSLSDSRGGAGSASSPLHTWRRPGGSLTAAEPCPSHTGTIATEHALFAKWGLLSEGTTEIADRRVDSRRRRSDRVPTPSPGARAFRCPRFVLYHITSYDVILYHIIS